MDPFEKSTTVDPEVRAYISSLVNAVGGSSTYDNSYSIGDDAAAVLKDLQRWLRLYDEKTNRLDVKRCLAEANLVQGDLLEILALWPEDGKENKLKSKLALACLELLVPLTWPVALEDDKATLNHHRHVPYLQLAQVGYKRAVLHYEYAKILRTAVRVALPSMAQPRRERSKRDEGIIKLMLYFFRNITMITQPQHLPSQGDENEVSRSATIEVFHDQEIFNALLTIGSGLGDEFQDQDVIILEIMFHLLKGVDARKLFLKEEEVRTEETDELKMLMQKEKAMLNSYKKSAPTRHNRFGTMLWVKREDMKMSTVSGQTSITDKDSTLHQMDASKKWNKPQYRGKLTQEFDEFSEFGMRVELTEKARGQLRGFVEDFLDSSFNPLFASLRKAIEREQDRVQGMHHKQYFYLISWFLTAEAARRDQAQSERAWHSDRPTQTIPEDNTFAYIAAVLDQETFVLLNRQMQTAFDNKSWQDLQATLLCFTQILLTVQSMAESKDEEDQEIAENIQGRIFYEETTHDRIVQSLRGYTHQGFAYLDAVTECVHVFVRMLERYSKQNVDLQIRSKRRARKKRAQHSSLNEDGERVPEVEDAEDDEREAHRAVSERKFDFARFSAKFLSQPCVNTFISLTHYYKDLTPAQLKRAHRFFYRLAFKHELTVLLFRADILQLLHKMIKGPEGLDSAMEGFRDWEQLVQQVFRRCIKWMERDTEGTGWKEAAVVEMLFSKIPATIFYLQNGYEKVVEKRAPRPPAELEVKPSVPQDQRLAVAVSILIENAKADAVEWVKKQVQSAADERRSWEDEEAARRGNAADTEDADAVESIPAPSIFIVPDNEDRKLALFKDKHLRLLLTTLGCQRLGLAEDVEAAWIIPSDVTAATLIAALDQIKAAEFAPPTFENEKTASDLIRTKPTGRSSGAFGDSDSDTDADGDGGLIDDAMFPPNLKEARRPREDGEKPKKRRKRRNSGPELTEEEIKTRALAKAKKEREKNSKIKSKLYVTNSDDESDEEADAEFFRLEAERRRKTDGVIRSALTKAAEAPATEVGKAGKKRKKDVGGKKSAKKRRTTVDSDNEDEEMGSEDEPSAAATPIELSDNSASSSEDSDAMDEDEADPEDVPSRTGKTKETPSTSPTPGKESVSPKPLREVSANTTTARLLMNDDDDDEDDMPVFKPAARRNVRAAFTVESDSE
jgi:replication fork protection complex subunit Tof1/Swi1